MANNITAKTSADGKNLIITVPLERNPELSASKKTLVVGSSRGFIETEAEYSIPGKNKGKVISISLNATIKP